MNNSILMRLFVFLFSLASFNVCYAQAGSTVERSVREWVACDGVGDDRDGFVRAIDAASAGGFTLVVDCVVRIKVGEDVGKPIFMRDNLSVRFSTAGKVVVDNIFVPAFVLANVSNVSLLNWVVEYDAQLPTDPYREGYYNNGVFVRFPYNARPAYAFNDVVLKKWLVDNKGVQFVRTNPWWTGPTATMAVFHVRGTAGRINVNGMRIGVDQRKGGHQFVPMAFSFIPGPKSGVTVSDVTPYDGVSYAVPSNINMKNIVLDGVYMGFLGNLRDATFSGVKSLRYGDLQDEFGGNVGGVGKWFPPPHLFYLHSDLTKDASLQNRNLKLIQTRDEGVRVGVARDSSASAPRSGYANSLKIGGVDVLVDGYYSARPDGFLDLLPSERLTINKLSGTYNSAFLNNLYPGIRFPSLGYKDVRLTNIRVADVSREPILISPIGSMAGAELINIDSAIFRLSSWGGGVSMLQQAARSINGRENRIALDFQFPTVGGDLKVIRSGRDRDAWWYMGAEPQNNKVGSSTKLSWEVSGVESCYSDVGDWEVVTSSGVYEVTSQTVGYFKYGLVCPVASSVSDYLKPEIGVGFGYGSVTN